MSSSAQQHLGGPEPRAAPFFPGTIPPISTHGIFAGQPHRLELRTPKAEDAARIIELRQRLGAELMFGHAHETTPGVGVPTDSCSGLSIALAPAEAPQAQADRGDCVGWVGLARLPHSPSGLCVREFCITPHLRGRGLGRWAMTMFVEHCRARSLDVELSVGNLNPAKQLYLELGFQAGPLRGGFCRMYLRN